MCESEASKAREILAEKSGWTRAGTEALARVMMAVLGMSVGHIGIWKYLFWRSSLEKNLEPEILVEKSVTVAMLRR